MEKDLGRPLETVNVDGGAAANNLMMQFQADVLGVRLRRPKYLETTSLGAVFAAGLGVKVWRDFGELEKAWQEDRSFLPQWEPSKRSAALDLWSQAIARTLGKK